MGLRGKRKKVKAMPYNATNIASNYTTRPALCQRPSEFYVNWNWNDNSIHEASSSGGAKRNKIFRQKTGNARTNAISKGLRRIAWSENFSQTFVLEQKIERNEIFTLKDIGNKSLVLLIEKDVQNYRGSSFTDFQNLAWFLKYFD